MGATFEPNQLIMQSMKQFIFIISMMMVGSSSFSNSLQKIAFHQITQFNNPQKWRSLKLLELKAIGFTYCVGEDDNWGSMQTIEVPVIIDFVQEKITIFSAKRQVFNFEKLKDDPDPTYVMMEGYAIDTESKKVFISLVFTDNNEVYMVVFYEDVKFAYKMIKYTW